MTGLRLPKLTTDEQDVLWGLVLFTCMFQTLHRISLKATKTKTFVKFVGVKFVGVTWQVFTKNCSYRSSFPCH